VVELLPEHKPFGERPNESKIAADLLGQVSRAARIYDFKDGAEAAAVEERDNLAALLLGEDRPGT